jgi:hypothetical protein
LVAVGNDTVVIGGKEVKVESGKLDIFELKYYGDNPRINSLVSKLPQPASQTSIEKEIWDLDSVHELFGQIKNNGGLIEPVLVKGNEVIEGNCRLCCYRQLYEKASDGDKGKWREIPVKILPQDLTEKEVFILLGTIHVNAKTPWDPFEKASYIYRMGDKLKEDLEQIANLLGMEKGEAWRAGKVYEFMIRNEMKDTKKYSYVDEYIKSPDLRRMTKDDPTFEASIVDWINTESIPDAQSMRQLSAILTDPKVGPKFRSGILDFNDALDATKERHPEMASTFYKKIKNMRTTLDKARIPEIQAEIEKDKRKKATIEYFIKAVHRFEKNIDLK